MADQTKGQKMVRVSFNPSTDNGVDVIKSKTAELIDLIETFRDRDPRLASLAQTHYEDAAMWAVKCITTPMETKK